MIAFFTKKAVPEQRYQTNRQQEIKKGKRGCSGKHIHPECIVRMDGSGLFYPDTAWYNTQEHGHHLNRLIGFSTDFFADDSLELVWRPAVTYGHIDLFARVRMGGMIHFHREEGMDFIMSVQCDRPFYFDIKHYVPTRIDPKNSIDSQRIATFAVNGKVVTRAYGVKPGWVGWLRDMRYMGRGGSPVNTIVDFSFNLNRVS